jgi:hypothetical protein
MARARLGRDGEHAGRSTSNLLIFFCSSNSFSQFLIDYFQFRLLVHSTVDQEGPEQRGRHLAAARAPGREHLEV